jgi:hypothetical protein
MDAMRTSRQAAVPLTGKIDKLTYKLGPTQMSSDEQKVIRHALERARD